MSNAANGTKLTPLISSVRSFKLTSVTAAPGESSYVKEAA